MSGLVAVRWLSAGFFLAASLFFVVMNTVSAVAASRARIVGKRGPSTVPLVSLALAACTALVAPVPSARWLGALFAALDPGNVALLAFLIRRMVAHVAR
jgi:hypothetical protein